MSTAERCRNHLQAQATYACYMCKSPICEECVCTLDNGAIVCPSCAAPEPLAAPTPAAPPSPLATDSYELAAAPTPMEPVTSRASIGPCRNHPEVAAVAQCDSCRSLICATCDFPFGTVHLCPTCATNPSQGLTPKRKAMAYWSIGLGAVNLLVSIGLFVTSIALAGKMDAGFTQFLGCFVILCILAAAAGFVMGITAFNRRSHNPGYLWIGPILNGLVGGMWLMLIIVGLSRNHYPDGPANPGLL
ncbi:MAG: hypothetical protein WCI73_04910 [Phycisphaerae bacterium]